MTRLERSILDWLRVPADPHPPAGSAESVRIFRAGPNYYTWRVAVWAMANLGVLILLLFQLGLGWTVSVRFRQPWLALWYLAEALLFAHFALVAVINFVQQRLNYRMRWYIVTDRCLRIRSGIWSVQELTMTFANIQEIRVASGPFQKYLGLADVEVHSAGAGRAGPHGSTSGNVAKFAGVDNANEIRDFLTERLRQYRDSGLGEAAPKSSEPSDRQVLAAAAAALKEAKALRQTAIMEAS